MATLCLPMRSAYTMAHTHHKIKSEPDSSGDDQRISRQSSSPTIPITDVMTANENWRGKNDPAERRRIQNRLNQRAFRQRQRAGESPKQYKPRSASGASSGRKEESDDEAESPQSESSKDSVAASQSYIEGRPTSAPPSNTRPSGVTDAQTGQVWDELAQLINRNFLAAAVANAQHVGIDLTALRAGSAIRTPRPSSSNQNNNAPRPPVPASLTPVELQHQVSHDPIIDTIPHARLRFNILRGISTGRIDSVAFSRSIRASGALEELSGSWQRGGVVVWSSPEQVSSWELSEPFLRRWSFLLQGCEDLIAATNAWRGRRNERLFPLSFT